MNEILKYYKGYFRIYTGFSGLSVGVTGREINSVNYDDSHDKIRSGEKRILNSISGIKEKNIVMLDQVHGKMIIHVVNEPSCDLPAVGEADALITAIKGVMLVIRSADCVPVILYDPEKNVLAAIHSGWKGSMLNISGGCVKEMVYLYGSDPGSIRAFILPSIGPDAYEVNNDVACHFPDNTITADGKIFVDLWGAVEGSLKNAGISGSNIHNARICNRTNHSDFFSHRYGDTGRNLNFAFMK